MHTRDFRSGIETRATNRNGAVVVRALSGMVAGVAANRYGFTYAGPGNAQPHTRMLAVAPAAGAPAVRLTRENVVNRSYPLSRYLYIYINRPPGKPVEANVKEFLRVVLSRQGRNSSAPQSAAALPPAVARAELAKIE